MRILAVGFFLGSLAINGFTTLPNVWIYLAVGLFACSMASIFTRFKGFCNFPRIFIFIAVSFSAGLLYTSAVGYRIQAAYLPSTWEGKDIQIEGQVLAIPELKTGSTRFLFKVKQLLQAPAGITGDNSKVLQGHKIRLNWYRNRPTLHAGERWLLQVRLKRPYGSLNPNTFDYERWLFTQGLVATGYVRASDVNQRLSESPYWWPDRWREKIKTAIAQALPEEATASLLQGLAVAYRTEITDEQWDIMRRTGTSHLLAISGLHIALVASLGFLPVLALWFLFPQLYLRLPVRIAGSVLGVIFACAYALLAGFSLPTQRALIMVVIVLLALMQRQRMALSRILALALLAVLLFDPLASLSASFWLSFAAVALIGLLLNRRHQAKPWQQWLQVQWGLSLALIPLTAVWFGSFSLISPIANLIAIPWVTGSVVPLVLLGVIVLPFSAVWAAELWWLAAQSLQVLFDILTYFSTQTWALWTIPALPWYWLLVSLLGVALWLLPAGMPGRYLSVVCFLPLFVWQVERPQQSEFCLDVLDVGQGLATVVRTAQHNFLFDTGPRFRSGFDSGEAIILPWLQAQGVRSMDAMMISHDDLDHSGGARSILAALPVQQLWVNTEKQMDLHPTTGLCRAGLTWRWDGVDFTVLHPSDTTQTQSDNDFSCVIRVSNGNQSVLLVADIAQAVERQLIRQFSELKSDVLLVGHHGSKTSSSAEWLQAVEPEIAIVSAGYRNAFGHPHPDVVARYQRAGITLFSTIDSGAIHVDFSPHVAELKVEAYRREYKKFWNR